MEPNVEIIFCDGFQNQSVPNNPPSISNPLTSLKPYAIPGNYSFAVYCSIEKIPAANKNISFEIGEVDGNVFLPKTQIPMQAINSSGEFATINLGIDLRNVVVSKEGDVYVKIRMDDTVIGEKKIGVSQLLQR